MNPWICAGLITLAGAVGGFVNAIMTEHGLHLPEWRHEIWCPGFLGNIITGAFAAFASWAFYGSGAGIEIAALQGQSLTTLRFSALAGAFLVGLAGAKWLSNEVDKHFLTNSIVEASGKELSSGTCAKILTARPQDVLEIVQHA